MSYPQAPASMSPSWLLVCRQPSVSVRPSVLPVVVRHLATMFAET